jgi:hypothetical protein
MVLFYFLIFFYSEPALLPRKKYRSEKNEVVLTIEKIICKKNVAESRLA